MRIDQYKDGELHSCDSYKSSMYTVFKTLNIHTSRSNIQDQLHHNLSIHTWINLSASDACDSPVGLKITIIVLQPVLLLPSGLYSHDSRLAADAERHQLVHDTLDMCWLVLLHHTL